MTARDTSISPPRLLEAYPPRSGVVEVLGYVQIASDDDHALLDEESDVVLVPGLLHPLEIPG